MRVHGRSVRVAAALACAAGGLIAVGVLAGPSSASTTPAQSSEPEVDSCPNAAFRVGFSAGLPDCRAYEMVSPPQKNGGDVSAEPAGPQFVVSESGDRVVYMSHTGFGDTEGSGDLGITQYLAEREPSGWASKSITPTPATDTGLQAVSGVTYVDEFSADLGLAGLIGYNLPNSPVGAAPDTENLYLENTRERRLLATLTDDRNEGETAVLPQEFGVASILGGASASMDVVTFESVRNLVPEAHGSQYKAYVFENGAVKLLGVLPDGSVPPGGSRLMRTEEGGSIAGFPFDNLAIEFKDTVSTDGSRILFEVLEDPGQIFMRDDGSRSVLISEAETSSPVTASRVKFMAASSDLRHILFSTSTRLLDGAPEGGGIYMYTDGPDPESERNLTYIGPGGPVLGMTDDASHIYAVNDREIYLWDDGARKRIAPESGVGGLVVISTEHETASVSADGTKMAFMADAPLTRTAKVSSLGAKKAEMYVYDEAGNSLACVSCPGTGAVATEGVSLIVEDTDSGHSLPMAVLPRFLSRDGRYVFFNTEEALVLQDTNGVMDAYEYDTVTGQLSLISTGSGESPAWFVNASADGRDAFIATRQPISRWDVDQLNDLYDARAGGGLPEPPPVQAQCAGDACQGTSSAAPSFNTASGFQGVGNPTLAAGVSHQTSATPEQRLRRALARCRRKPRRKRALCRRAARRRYPTGKSAGHSRRAGR
jgi:hypothetical protein